MFARRRFSFLLTLLLAAAPATAEEWQSTQEIRTAVESYVKAELATLPGVRTVSVSRIDERLRLPKCARLETQLPAGNRLWGNTSIGVRCSAPSAWAIHVPVQVRVSDDVLVTLRPLASGRTIQAEDVQLQQRDITLFAGSALKSLEQTAGKMLAAPVAAGQPLRAEMLRVAKIIRQGQNVQLVASGRGFRITSEATAMGNAGIGETLTVKTRSGQLVKARVTADGVAEVTY